VSVNVRPAIEDDLDAAVDLYAEVAAEGRWIGGEAPTDKPERRAVFQASIQRDDAQVFVAEEDGRAPDERRLAHEFLDRAALVAAGGLQLHHHLAVEHLEIFAQPLRRLA